MMARSKNLGLNHRTFFDYFLVLSLAIIAFVTFYPFWSVLVISLNDPTDTLAGRLWLLPRKWTLQNFTYLFNNSKVVSAFFMSVSRTVLGAFCSVMFTAAVAYALSKKHLIGQKFYMGLVLLTMYIGGGLIPFFIVIKSVGLYQNFLVYIIPALFSSYYSIIMFSYFKTLPPELEESVKVDGGTDLVIFFKIVIPVSMPMMAAITLFFAVGQWNAWFDTLLFGGGKLMTLQAVLVMWIRDTNDAFKWSYSGRPGQEYVSMTYKPTVQTVEATCMMITAIPIMLVYPFLQKYFVKGIMIGSIKG
jgi:putative aldouronate transport system permease protein